MTGRYRPDRTEKALHFGCAFLFVAPCVFFLFLLAYLRLHRDSVESLFWPVLVSLVIGGVAGMMAAVEGDGFWERISQVLKVEFIVSLTFFRVATIVALIALLGSAARTVLRGSAESDASRQQRENSFRTPRAWHAARDAAQDKAIRNRTDRADRERARPMRTYRDTMASDLREKMHIPIQPAQPASVDVSLVGCEYLGGSLTCRLLLKNAGSFGANVALRDNSSFAYDEHGNEYRLQQATLGSQRWLEEEPFGGVRLEPGIPVEAELQFDGVPESAQRGQLLLVLAKLQVFERDPHWQRIVFEDVPFG